MSSLICFAILSPMPGVFLSPSSDAMNIACTHPNLFSNSFARLGPTFGRQLMRYSCCSFSVIGFLSACGENSFLSSCSLFAIDSNSSALSFSSFVYNIGIP